MSEYRTDYPNERDCEHGQLRRSCPICAIEGDYASLLARHRALREERDKLSLEVMRLVNKNEQLHERNDALWEAKLTISECLQECAYVAGAKAGWNAAMLEDYVEARKRYAQIVSDTDRRLATLKAARAEVDRLLEEK